MQSPINLDVRIANGADLGPLKIENIFNSYSTTLKNISTTVELTLPNECYVSGGPLNARYKFKSMHFHWGNEDNEGSEHSMGGERMAMEAHFVFEYKYQFRAPMEILEATKKLTDLKWKVDHPDEEEEEDEDDDFVEDEEEETEEEMLERYYRDLANFEKLEKRKMDEWGEKRLQIMLKDKEEGEKKNEEVEPSSPKKENMDKNPKGKEKSEEEEELEQEWNAFRHKVEHQSNLQLDSYSWHLLKKKYEASQEIINRLNEKKKQRAFKGTTGQLVPEEEKNANKALKLELEAMTRMEMACLEKSKTQYLEWIKGEDLLDKKLKRELRENFEAYLEEMEEREELDDDADISEEEKRKTRIRWTIQDERKEEASREKLKKVIDRRKRDLDRMCNSDITAITVVGILFKADDNAPPYDLFEYLSYVKKPLKEISIDGNMFKQFKRALTSSEYFTYTGSLTAPPFTENVNWLCLKDPLPVRSDQVQLFREIDSGYGNIDSNIRPLQNLEDRSVYYNKGVVVFKEPPCPGKDICSCSMSPQKPDWPKIV